MYSSIYRPIWYDSALGLSYDLPVWVLTQTATEENGDYYTAVGLAALDGSWFTGMIYRAGISNYIFATSAGLLMRLDEETAVMVGLSGRELFRWTADDFLPEGHPSRSWFLNEDLSVILRNCGSRLYYEPAILELDGPKYVWLDPYTGKEEIDPEIEEPMILSGNGVKYFDGGWCKLEGTTVTVHYNNNTQTSFSVPDNIHPWFSVTPDYFLFHAYNGQTSFLCDHSGTVIATGDGTTNPALWKDSVTGITYPYLYEVDPSGEGHYTFTLLNPDGSERTTFVTSNFFPSAPYSGLITVIDDLFYRLTDLTTGEDLIRIPRWLTRDLPADE